MSLAMFAHDHPNAVHYFIRLIRTRGKPCRRCDYLKTQVYTERNLQGQYLVDPTLGIVWDLGNYTSLAHPHCFCYLDIQMEVDLEAFQLGVSD